MKWWLVSLWYERQPFPKLVRVRAYTAIAAANSVMQDDSIGDGLYRLDVHLSEVRGAL